MSKRETILAAAVTALAGTSGVSTRIYRSRADALARDEFPALIVEPVNDVPVRESLGRLNWNFTFQVVTLVRSDTPDSSADPILADVHSKIRGSSTLMNLLVDLMPGETSWRFEQADKTLLVVPQQFEAIYQTQETTISS